MPTSPVMPDRTPVSPNQRCSVLYGQPGWDDCRRLDADVHYRHLES